MIDTELSNRGFPGECAIASRHRLCAISVWLLLVALPSSAARAQTKFDPTQFIVVGEGLAAGMADFALRDVYQDKSFPAQMARQMNTILPQPLIQTPGIGSAPGFTALPPRLPTTLQGSVREPFPPYLFVFNLSVPGYKLADSATRKPIAPLIQQRDLQQTVINFILGYPALIAGTDLPLWTQTEYAVQMKPTFVLVELGYYDVLDAAVKDDATLLPDVATFKNSYANLLSSLQTSSPRIVVLNIPDPFDTAYFTTLDEATRLVGATPDVLESRYKLKHDDLLSPYGLMVVGNLTLGNVIIDNPLFPGLGAYLPGTVVSAATKQAVSSRVQALNDEIAGAASQAGAKVYDLKALFSRIKSQGLQVGSDTLTADFLGGFYSLDGYYPGQTGHALIANELLQLLNSTYGTSYATLDLSKVASSDPAKRFTPSIKKKPHPPREMLQ